MGTFYRSRHELILAFKHGTAPHCNTFELGQQGRYRTNVWQYRGVNTRRAGRLAELALHPTVKPVQLIADAIRDVSGRGEIVLDVFGGAGSTLIAAEKTGRRARLCELDPLYCDRILARWEAYAKDEAERLRGASHWVTSRVSRQRDESDPHPPSACHPRAYDVGYGKPPSASRFKKGQSGNPRGRPKGARARVPARPTERLKDLLLEEASRLITVPNGDRTMTLSMMQAAIRTLAIDAVKASRAPNGSSSRA